MRPFLKEATRNKFILVGTSKKEIYESLAEDVDHNVIPVIFGGENPTFAKYS